MFAWVLDRQFVHLAHELDEMYALVQPEGSRRSLTHELGEMCAGVVSAEVTVRALVVSAEVTGRALVEALVLKAVSRQDISYRRNCSAQEDRQST
mmetsp:Transcript_47142/g.98831  ORF Transcript_47142/g.98831 Transcript_47142/m.98831 type:complete len:95 (-) Transcript_47142:59-343(-)